MQQIWFSHHQPVKLSFADQTSFLYLQQSFKATGWHQAIRVIQTTLMALPGVQLLTTSLSPLICPGPGTKDLKRWEKRIFFPFPFNALVPLNNVIQFPTFPRSPLSHCFQAVTSQGSLGGPRRTHVFFSKSPCGKFPLSYGGKNAICFVLSLFPVSPGPGTWLTIVFL